MELWIVVVVVVKLECLNLVQVLEVQVRVVEVVELVDECQGVLVQIVELKLSILISDLYQQPKFQAQDLVAVQFLLPMVFELVSMEVDGLD